MQVEISCETIGRLARLNRTLPAGEDRSWLRSIFVEVRNGFAFAGATNAIFAAVESVGKTSSPDGFVVIRHDGVFLDAAEQSDPEVKCTISEWAEMRFCTLVAPNGYHTTADAALRDPDAVNTLKDWRKWFPDELPEVSGRPMFIDVDGLDALVQSSPSGRVVFPRVIDADLPVVVRDTMSAHWVGVFFARPNSGIFLKGSSLPDWLVK